MLDSLASYVPEYVARALVRQPGRNPVGRAQRFPAVVLFADISGFTPMSEALGRRGKAGVEELTAVLNTYFGAMIALAQAYGGSIAKFGGDALTVIFPYRPGRRAGAVRRAVTCALRMQAHMAGYAAIPTAAGQFRLSMHAGLAAGPLVSLTAGDPTRRLLSVLAGSALERCALAAQQARPGEIRVAAELQADLPAVGPPGDSPFAAVQDLHPAAARVRPAAQPAIPPAARPLLAAYLHPAIAARLATGAAGLVDEHRRISVLFAHFGGFDYDADPQVGPRLQAYLATVLHTVARYDGYLKEVDIGDKGSKYIVVFGAPLAHENDEARALRCALELAALPAVPTRIGINTGFVYCGLVGSPHRRDYTVMGDVVNVAARLMEAAPPGGILVGGLSPPLVRTFQVTPLAPHVVRGKAAPVAVWALHGLAAPAAVRLQEPAYRLPMVGRAAERAQAAACVARVRTGHGAILGLTAEAGMGKSRLGAEVQTLATGQGLAAYGGECQSHGTNTAYLAWAPIWRGLLGVDPAAPLAAQIAHLAARVATLDARLLPRLPLLGVLLHLPLPDNEVTGSLDARLRKTALEELLIDLLQAHARTQPLLLVLEDCHWIDPLSLDLLEALGRAIAHLPVLLLLLYRPPAIDARWTGQLAALPYFQELVLAEFSPDEAQQWIALKLAGAGGGRPTLPAPLVSRITSRAQGNPFYIEEMINLLRDRGVDPADAAAIATVDVPESLQQLIISRIDQLDESAKATLKVASVIGRLFKASWLWAVHPPLGAPAAVKHQLDLLSQLDITPLDKPAPDLEYLFKHIVTRDVAYESLAYATRAQLHAAVGAHLEALYAGEQDRWLDLLAYHYGLSHNVAKQREYFHRAAAAAAAAYANDTALAYYTRLLPLLTAAEQIPVLLKRGQVHQLVGQWDAAAADYHQALDGSVAAPDPQMQAASQMALGSLLELQGSFGPALEWLARAQAGFGALDDRPGLCDVLSYIGQVYRGQADFAAARSCAEQQLHRATALADRTRIARALGNLGALCDETGDQAGALSYLEQQLQMMAELGQRRGMMQASYNLAQVSWHLGDYQAALARFAQALQLAIEIGDRRGVSATVGGMGCIYYDHGDYAPALHCFAQHLVTASAFGNRLGTLIALGNSAAVYAAQHHYAAAEALCSRALQIARGLGIAYYICLYLYETVDLYIAQSRYLEAAPLSAEAVELVAGVDDTDTQSKISLQATRLRWLQGQVSAGAAITELTRSLATWPQDSIQAAIHYEIWRIDPHQVRHRQAARARYRQLYRQIPNIKYRQRYAELTGAQLPIAHPLPALSDLVQQRPVDPASLLALV